MDFRIFLRVLAYWRRFFWEFPSWRDDSRWIFPWPWSLQATEGSHLPLSKLVSAHISTSSACVMRDTLDKHIWNPGDAFCCALLGWQMSHFKSVSIVWEECVTGISRFVKAPLGRFYLRMIVRWSLSWSYSTNLIRVLVSLTFSLVN